MADPVQDLSPVAVKVANLLNAVGAEMQKPVLGVFSLLESIIAFASVDFVQLKADLLALDEAGRLKVEQAFSAALNLPQEGLTAKVQEAAADLLKALELAESLYALYAPALSLVESLKSLLGL